MEDDGEVYMRFVNEKEAKEIREMTTKDESKTSGSIPFDSESISQTTSRLLSFLSSSLFSYQISSFYFILFQTDPKTTISSITKTLNVSKHHIMSILNVLSVYPNPINPIIKIQAIDSSSKDGIVLFCDGCGKFPENVNINELDEVLWDMSNRNLVLVDKLRLLLKIKRGECDVSPDEISAIFKQINDRHCDSVLKM